MSLGNTALERTSEKATFLEKSAILLGTLGV
jgi:hypothetical protein